MSSLVIDLQTLSLDSKTLVGDLLRKALVVSTKLKIEEFKTWANQELNGYQDANVPVYRKIRGEPKVFNPIQGRWMPVHFSHPPDDVFTTAPISQSVAEIEDLLQKRTSNHFTISYPHHVQKHFLRDESFVGLVPELICAPQSCIHILDSVRNIILQWSLKLEQDGILGENMRFSAEEQNVAAGNTYHIQSFYGVIGDIKGGNVQIGDYNSVAAELKKFGVSQSERNELETISDELKANPSTEKKKNIAVRLTTWVLRNADKLHHLSDTIKSWISADHHPMIG